MVGEVESGKEGKGKKIKKKYNKIINYSFKIDFLLEIKL